MFYTLPYAQLVEAGYMVFNQASSARLLFYFENRHVMSPDEKEELFVVLNLELALTTYYINQLTQTLL